MSLNDNGPAASATIKSLGDVIDAEAPIVSVVFPCLNEELSVGACVDEAYAALNLAGLRGEVVVVDNNSTDDSAQVARLSGARVVSESKRGYGSALISGIASANAPLVIMADADMSYDLKQIPNLLKPLLENTADIVLGERITSADKGTMPYLHKRVGTPALTLLVKRASGGLNLKDSQSGFRAFRRRDILELSLTSSGMEFASEMLIRAARRGLRITELSTGYRVRTGSSKLSPLKDGWRHVREILRLAPNLLLVGPGVLLILCGVLLQVVSLTWPSGVDVGSLDESSLHGLSRGSLVIGGVLAVAGVGLDTFLFIHWIRVRHTFQLASALGGLAQSFLIIGTMLIGFSVIYSLVTGRRRG